MKIVLMLAAILLLALAAYSYSGWYDASRDSPALKAEAVRLALAGQGAASLTPRQRYILLAVEDPAFDTHNGIDWSTPGAGRTTMTQALSKKLAFEKFQPGIRKLRQSTYALGLEHQLSKDEILTLCLRRASFGDKDGQWIDGFANASQRFFGKPLTALDEDQFIALVATLISPGKFNPAHRNGAFETRVTRIRKLVAGQCQPTGHGDVQLEGCR